MEGEIEVDQKPTGVRMISKIDFTSIFQTGMTLAAVSLVVMVLNLSKTMTLVEYKLDQLAAQQTTFATKEQLDEVRKEVALCLPRAEAESRKSLWDMQYENLKSMVLSFQTDLASLKGNKK